MINTNRITMKKVCFDYPANKTIGDHHLTHSKIFLCYMPESESNC